VILAALAHASEPAPRPILVGVGLGGSFLAGEGSAAAFGGTWTERLAAHFAVSPFSSLGLELEHARHPLVDAGGLFEDGQAPEEEFSGGYRDYLVLDLGARVGFRTYADARPPIVPTPFFRLGMGAVFSATRFAFPSLQGTSAMESRATAPMLGIGLGCELRIRDWIGLTPQFKAEVLLAADRGEIDDVEVFRVESRLAPTLDLTLGF
jgi:hypothetical protein